ncbi:MAG: hypothetical protein M3326_16680 [Actinomycetota bacterium]|nr:hypothetical protein [Actinomycetota bacterium]
MRLRKTVVALTLAMAPLVALAGPASAASGAQQFRLFFVGSFRAGASNTGPVFATGPITGAGTAVNSGFVVGPTGEFVGNNQLRFPEGTVFVNFEGQLDSFNFDPRTCVTRILGHGTWEVADASGSLEGTTGGGTFTNDVTLIGRRTATGCSEETTEVSRITLTGELDVPDAAAA